MRTASGLIVISIGAILALAVHASTPGINLNLVGAILIAVGVAGLLLRSRTSGWLRRRIVLRPDRPRRRRSYTTERSGAHLVEDPAAIVDDPAVLAAEILTNGQADADDPATIG